MFAPQKSVNLTFFQRFVDYNWPTRKRTFRHILSFLSQLSVGPSLCRSRSSRASSEVSFRYIPKLRKLALNQEATRPEKGMCQLYKLRNFADAGSLQRKPNFGKFRSYTRVISKRRVSTENNLLSWRCRERVTYCSPPYHTSGNSQNLILHFTM